MTKKYNKEMAKAFSNYVLCPTTGRTIEGVKGDDKVICNCGPAMERGGTHIVSLCRPSTVEQWMKEHGYEDMN